MIGMLDRVKGWLFEEDDGSDGTVVHADYHAGRKRKPSLLSLHSTREEEIFIRRPRSREDAPICADCLRARCPVVVNLKSLEPDTALRVFDFLAGVVYAIEGQMESVGDGIFLLTPKEVEIATELAESVADEPDHVGFWQEQ